MSERNPDPTDSPTPTPPPPPNVHLSAPGSAEKSSTTSTPSGRSRRKINRVNYAEDAPQVYEEHPESNGASTKTNGHGNGHGGRRRGPGAKRDREKSPSSNDNFPLNWQRRIPLGEEVTAVKDFDGAKVKDDGILYFNDGTTLAPQGKFE